MFEYCILPRSLFVRMCNTHWTSHRLRLNDCLKIGKFRVDAMASVCALSGIS